MEKLPKLNTKTKKTSVLDGSAKSKLIYKDKEDRFEPKTESKKKGHTKSISNVEEFAWCEKKQLDEQLTNFVNNYEDLISGIKKTSLELKDDTKPGKTKSDGQINITNNSKHKGTHSAVNGFSELLKLDSLVTQVEEKFDIQNLTNIEEIKDYYEYTENCLLMISKLKIPDIKEIEHLQLDLPEKMTKKKLAIFDLDETLIHCELKNPSKADKLIIIKLPNGSKARIGLNIRPYIVPALEEIMKNYNMIIYTASDQSYADSVLAHIDPMRDYFKCRLYRHNCVKLKTETGHIYVKDLRIIKNVPLSNMIIIDNSVLSFAFHLDNGIPILPYYCNKEDIELNFLKGYLTKLAKYDNITFQNGATFNLKSVMEEVVNSNGDDYFEEEDESINITSKLLKSPKEPETKPNNNKISQNNKILDKNEHNKNGNVGLVRTKKIENLEVEEKNAKPSRKKSKLQNKIFEVLEKAKQG